jgi:xylulokinase
LSAGQLLCGVDAGTSRIRAVVFDLSGTIVAQASEPTPTVQLGPGQAEHDPQALWTVLTGLLRRVSAGSADAGRIRGVAVASMGEAGVLLDGAGRPLAPTIAWFDTRTAPILDKLLGQVGFEALHGLTGLCPDPTFSLLKLLWLKAQDPERFSRATSWLHVSDYLAWRLSGAMATDVSIASRTMALDIASGRWASALLDEVGIPQRLFQPLAASGQLLGAVTAQASAETGLPTDAAVAVAGHDHVCGTLAVGADQSGVLLDSMGTAEALTYMLQAPSRDPELGRQGFNQGHVKVDRPLWYIFGGIPTSAASVEWFRRAQATEPAHAELIAEAERIPPGSEGVLFLPHLRIGSPPFPDPIARGAFLGLADNTSRGAMFRAVLEGIALDAANILRILRERFQAPEPERIILIGGSTRNALLTRIKASAYGRPIEIAEVAESTSLGAAMLAGVACGIFGDLRAARTAMMRGFRTVMPDTERPSVGTDHWVDRYAQAYAGIRETMLRVRG